jgi:formate dehydrogenase
VRRADVKPVVPDYVGLDAYRARGGYRTLRECLAGNLGRDTVLDMLEEADLRGMGGAGFPSFKKIRFVQQGPKPRLVAINADEGEPGTFKDRHCFETEPHRVLEGALLAAWLVEAEDLFIYLRDEYPHIRELLALEIARLEAESLTGGIRIHMRRGAGAYVCGEESALLESLEGKRGMPRHKPPFPAQVGLFGRPTLVTNVETMHWLSGIVVNGPEQYRSYGRHGGHGLRLYSISGRVRRPGVKLAPVGITVRELIDEFAGGMLDGHKFKAYMPGGASGGIMPASLDDVPLTFGALEPYGCFIGSAAVVVISDKDDLKAVALNAMRFFADESCGQCTPCRVGTRKLEQLMSRPGWDEKLMTEIAQTMMDASICGLGQAAPNPLMSLFRHFREEDLA